MALKYSIDVLAVFSDRLWLRGWLFDEKPIQSLCLCAPGLEAGQWSLVSWGNTASPDVAAVHGEIGKTVRFDEAVTISPREFDITQAVIMVRYLDGEQATIANLGLSSGQGASELAVQFRELITGRRLGELLEVGSRARSGITRRNFAPEGWSYLGVDIIDGPNVDVVGDAHDLASIFPARKFDAVMAFSVLEHLLMPWKFIIELNRILNDGAVGLFTTHQCWPLHDQPQDFWRFSDQAWHGLLNQATGFEILAARMGEPAYVVAQRCHSVTNFGVGQVGFLASSVLFRKVSGTSLAWPVSVRTVLSTNYPN